MGKKWGGRECRIVTAARSGERIKMPYDQNEQPQRIGALWVKTSKKGVKYFSGSITVNGVTQKLVIFKNTRRTEDKHPEYNIMAATERQQ